MPPNSHRTFAKGTAWVTPVIVATTLATRLLALRRRLSLVCCRITYLNTRPSPTQVQGDYSASWPNRPVAEIVVITNTDTYRLVVNTIYYSVDARYTADDYI